MTVTPSDVTDRVDVELDDVTIQPYIDDANAEVERREQEQESELEAGVRDTIVAYLAAHYIRSARLDEREVESQSVDGQSATYAGQFGTGLQRTTPGEHAMRLAPTGFFGSERYTITTEDVSDA